MINNVEIEKNKNGFYSSRDIHRASGKNTGFRPDVFLDSQLAKDIVSTSIDQDGTRLEHVVRVSGSRPRVFFSPVLSMAYIAWLGCMFTDFLKFFEEEAYGNGYADGATSKEAEIRDEVFNEGYQAGYQASEHKLEEFAASLPSHPVQRKSISSSEAWHSVFPESDLVPQDFLTHLLLRASSYRNLGREDVLSEYDWKNNCYWMTPEFAFSITSFFPDGSPEQMKILGFIKASTDGRVWASNL